MSLDPYREWLQISPDRRPPNHYDLLGLEALEPDADLIRAAGMRRIADVRRYQVGPHSETAIRVMGELAAAFSCLTDAARKKDYDAHLRGADTVRASTTALAPSKVSDTVANDRTSKTVVAKKANAQPAEPISFDPYAEWLNISPDRRPPSFYDLVGVDVGEADLDRIRLVGLERIARVRRYQVGPRSDAAIELLAEMSRAFTCLTDFDRKQAYDEEHGIIAAAPATPHVPAEPAVEPPTGAGVIKWKPAPPPEPEPPPALKLLLAAASLPGRLDRGLAYFAGGADNRFVHNFLRLALALVVIGTAWAGLSLRQTPEVAATPPEATHNTTQPEVPSASQSTGAEPGTSAAQAVVEWPDWIVAEGMSSILRPRELPANPAECYLDGVAAHGASFNPASSQITWTPPIGIAGQTLEFTLLRRGAGAPAPAARFKAIVVSPVLANSLQMEFAFIPAGTFLQGSSETDPLADSHEKPQRSVELTRPFYLGVHEVTQAQWQQVMADNPSQFIGDDLRPVERVSWDRAVEFCNRLSQREGLPPNFVGQPTDGQSTAWGGAYRLPTEAEWEYACRAGTTTPWSFGDDAGLLDVHAWGQGNSGGSPHPVGLKPANPWGLRDMHGNIWEWCWDRYASNAYATGNVADPRGPPEGTKRVVRGGGWNFGPPTVFRCSFRSSSPPDRSLNFVGLRVARDFSPPPGK